MDALTPLSEKRRARESYKALAKQADAQHAFNERARQGKRTVIYGPRDPQNLASEFARSEDLHIEGVITSPARLSEFLELVSAQEHIDKIILTHPDTLPYRDLIRLLTTARTAGVEVITLGNINFSRRMIFGVLS